MEAGNNNEHRIIRETIQKIALHGMINKSDGTIKDLNRTPGFVEAVYTDDKKGYVVDVREYGVVSEEGEWREGYLHKKVQLGAIENMAHGVVIVPKLMSDVVVVTDPSSKTEYVSMFSCVDVIQMRSHEKVSVGVWETEKLIADANTPDVDKLEETGQKAYSLYTKDEIVDMVTTPSGNDDKDKSSYIKIGKEEILEHVRGGFAELKMNKDLATLNYVPGGEDYPSEITMKNGEMFMSHNRSEIVLKDENAYVGSSTKNENAVLGVALADFLIDFLNGMVQMKTSTQMGPQPPINIATFTQLMTKCKQFKDFSEGFIAKHVFIQKG